MGEIKEKLRKIIITYWSLMPFILASRRVKQMNKFNTPEQNTVSKSELILKLQSN